MDAIYIIYRVYIIYMGVYIDSYIYTYIYIYSPDVICRADIIKNFQYTQYRYICETFSIYVVSYEY